MFLVALVIQNSNLNPHGHIGIHAPMAVPRGPGGHRGTGNHGRAAAPEPGPFQLIKPPLARLRTKFGGKSHLHCRPRVCMCTWYACACPVLLMRRCPRRHPRRFCGPAGEGQPGKGPWWQPGRPGCTPGGCGNHTRLAVHVGSIKAPQATPRCQNRGLASPGAAGPFSAAQATPQPGHLAARACGQVKYATTTHANQTPTNRGVPWRPESQPPCQWPCGRSHMRPAVCGACSVFLLRFLLHGLPDAI